MTAAGSLDRCKQRTTAKISLGGQLGEMASAAGRKQFPTKFVWDHGGSEVRLAINGGPPIHLQREEDGTFEVTDNPNFVVMLISNLPFKGHHKLGPRSI